eukprot:SAG11_NODE_2820_length_2940_cov_3.224217_1_plen_149_part_00
MVARATVLAWCTILQPGGPRFTAKLQQKRKVPLVLFPSKSRAPSLHSASKHQNEALCNESARDFRCAIFAALRRARHPSLAWDSNPGPGIQPVNHGRVRLVGQVSAKTRHHHANIWMRDSAHLVAHHGGRHHQVQWRVVRNVREDDLT